jgi:predicted PurR-regulated permease PerM
MPPKFTFNRELISRIFFFSVFAFLTYQVFLLSKPFLTPILIAAMLAITLYPFYNRLRRTVRNPSAAALIMTVGTIIAGVLPFLGLAWFVIQEAHNLIPTATRIMQEIQNGDLYPLLDHLPEPIVRWIQGISAYLNTLEINLRPIVFETVQNIGARLTMFGSMFARNALFMFFKLLIFVIALFFAFLDGDVFLKWFLGLIPMETSHKQAVAKRAYDTFRAVTSGVFITAAMQGITAMIGFLIAGVHLPVLLGLATGVVSLLGASFIITFPVALFMFKDSTGWGIFLLVWGMVVVGWLDNLLKPYLIGSRARMPFVLVFFSILGGLKMYGLLGLILGPILIASLLTFIKIYRDTYEGLNQ